MASQRFVKYVLTEALRIVGEETDYIEAPATAYERAFDTLTDMLSEWKVENHCLFRDMPQSMYDTINTDEPINALIYNLAVRLAPKFRTECTNDAYKQAVRSLQVLLNKNKRLPTWDKPSFMPRGSANIYPYYFVVSNRREKHDHTTA